ncbi:MAG: S1-like domain-containing RNA-binding protein [Bacteroidetes bacterium]|nr:S1-like domain-containing RNA-binding protein [Bacteroidota bacterium]
MIAVGQFNDLRILRSTSVGLFLGDESGEDVLLPNKYCPEEYEIDDILKVFVYRDYDERKICTNIIPKIQLHGFALLECAAVSEFGAFMDWGLEKHLMVPFREQRQKMVEGRWYVVYLDLDTETDRLYGSNKLDKWLKNEELTVSLKDEVSLVVISQSDLGFNVIVNHRHKGLVYDNEVYEEIHIGDEMKGFVKAIREDNKLDISLQPIGYKNATDVNCETVYQEMALNNGFLALTDKSSPDEIAYTLGMSKKAFKKAIGALYKERKIKLEKDGIYLLE